MNHTSFLDALSAAECEGPITTHRCTIRRSFRIACMQRIRFEKGASLRSRLMQCVGWVRLAVSLAPIHRCREVRVLVANYVRD